MWKRIYRIGQVTELGRYEFPTTVTGAYDVLIMEEHRILEKYNTCTKGKRGTSFLQEQERTNE